MSATTEQKVDFLLKKVGFTLSKTGSVTGTGAISGGTTKEPFAESLPSPLVVPDSSIWNQSLSIPTTPPGSDTSIVKVYSTSSALRMTADSSVSGSRAFIAYTTYNNTSSARLTDWIDTQFGTAYVLKVYKGDPNSSGTLLPAGGSGSNDGWFFDYSSGVLNFNGSGLPSGVTDSNIYIVGYRYIGSKGISSPASINPTNLFVSGISTFAGLVDINAGGQANTFKVEDLTSGRVVLAGTGGEIEDSGNLTFNGNTLGITGSQTISSNFSVTGVSTFTGDVDANSQIKGYTNLSAPHSATTKTFTVTVASKDASHRYNGTGSGSGYLIDGVQSPILTLTPGRTYRFTNDNTGSHPLKFYLEADKTTNYTTGVNFQNSYTEITISDETPNVLHYQCTAHGYMGNAIVTNSNVVNSNYAATLRGGLSVTGGETTLSSATVSDLTDNRVVIAGTSGALEDSGNLTFNGSQLGITGTVNASSTITGTEFHTGASGSAIRVSSNTISGPATITLDPAAVGNNTGKVVIAGDLQVDGTTTTVNSTTVNIVDKNIQVATGAADDAAANGGGITIASGDGNKTFQFEATGDNLGSSENLNLASGKDYKINNTSVLNATTLGSGVVNSSLTSVGTLTSLNVTGNITGAGDLTLTDTTADSAAGPEFKLFRNSASPADADYLGQIKFAGESDTGVERNYAKITGKILDASNGTEDGIIEFAHIKAGSQTITGRWRSDSLQLLNGTSLTVAGTLDVTGITSFTKVGVADSITFNHNPENYISHNIAGLDIVSAGSNKAITYAADNHFFLSGDATKTHAFFNKDAQVELYFNNNLKFETNNAGAVVTGILSATSLTGTLQTAAQPNITSVGTLGSLVVSGQTVVGSGVTLNATGVIATGVITATSFSGDGSNLTGIDASALKFGGAVKAQANGFGVVVTGVTTSSGGFSGNLTGNVTGNVTGNADTATLATDLAINGTNQIVYQSANNNSAILPTGSAGQILQSNGSGSAPQWVTSAPAGAIEGITIREESTIVGTANSISTINFIGSVVTADAASLAGIATVTIDAIAGLGVSEGSGSKATGATGLDFVGPLVGVDAASNTGISTVRVEGLSIKDEGSTVGTAGSITTINFVGTGIAAAVSGNTATVTSSGASTDDIVALAIALG